MNKLNLKRFQNSTVAISFFWVAMIFLYIIGFVFLSFNAKAQGYKRVIVTESSLMDGMYWSIGNCDLDTTLFSGNNSVDEIVYMPKNYKVLMRDFDGNAWGGSVMIIVNYPELDSALTLDYYNATQNLIVHDCGCNDSTYFDQNLHPYDLSVIEISNILFKPTIYYDMLGRVVTPTKGMYIASDGILRKKIYIDEIK
tara:strand:+ start:2274 stop:2864 length:591 start_codon:yes stop_codon:yes gene_type:complete